MEFAFYDSASSAYLFQPTASAQQKVIVQAVQNKAFLRIIVSQVRQGLNFPVLKLVYSGISKSIPWLLMPWLIAFIEHQQ